MMALLRSRGLVCVRSSVVYRHKTIASQRCGYLDGRRTAWSRGRMSRWNAVLLPESGSEGGDNLGKADAVGGDSCERNDLGTCPRRRLRSRYVVCEVCSLEKLSRCFSPIPRRQRIRAPSVPKCAQTKKCHSAGRRAIRIGTGACRCHFRSHGL
jgi:hypothetical protein